MHRCKIWGWLDGRQIGEFLQFDGVGGRCPSARTEGEFFIIVRYGKSVHVHTNYDIEFVLVEAGDGCPAGWTGEVKIVIARSLFLGNREKIPI